MPVNQEQYDALLDNLKWVHAIASILVEEQGGTWEVSRDTLVNYDLRGELRIKDEMDHYTVEVIPPAVEGEVAQ